MKMLLFSIMLIILVGCAAIGKRDRDDIRIKWSKSEYNSRAGIYTRSYCSDGKIKQIAKVKLNEQQIEELIQSAHESIENEMTIDPDTGEKVQKICITSGHSGVDITILNSLEEIKLPLYSCEYNNMFNKTVRRLIFESENVKSLEPSDCRFY